MKISKILMFISFSLLLFGCMKFNQRAEDRFVLKNYDDKAKNRQVADLFIKENPPSLIRKELLNKFKAIDPSEIDDFFIQWKRITVISQSRDDIFIIFGFKSSDKKFDTGEVLLHLKSSLAKRAEKLKIKD